MLYPPPASRSRQNEAEKLSLPLSVCAPEIIGHGRAGVRLAGEIWVGIEEVHGDIRRALAFQVFGDHVLGFRLVGGTSRRDKRSQQQEENEDARPESSIIHKHPFTLSQGSFSTA